MSELLTMDDFIDGKVYGQIPVHHRANLSALYVKIMALRRYCDMPFIIRSIESPSRGYRTMEQHYRVYEVLAKKSGTTLENMHIPLKSQHLVGAACDIADPNRVLQKWILDHLEIAERLDLYFEGFEWTPTWVHAQLYVPGSGNRFFKP